MATSLDHPYRFAADGRTVGTGDADHIRDLIEIVLLTAPGERVMRPDFGAGLNRLVFEPNSVTLAATAQFLVSAGLQRHLSHLIAVDDVAVDVLDATFRVSVRYQVLADGSRGQALLDLPGAGA